MIQTLPAGVDEYLREAELAAERLAAAVRVAAIVMVIALQLVLLGTARETSSIVYVSLVAAFLALAYGLATWRLVRHAYRPVIGYVGVAFDVVALTAATIVAADVLGGGSYFMQATKGPFTALYFVIVALAGLRQAPRLVVFAGALGTAGYLSLIVPVWLVTPSLITGDLERDFTGTGLAPVRMLTFASVLIVATVILSTTAVRARRLVGQAVSERTAAIEQEERRKALLGALERYFPQKEALQLLDAGRELPRGGERCAVTVLTADIRGFTSLAERLGPDQVVALLNRYFDAMVEIVFDHQGTLISFVGDALWAVFGLPEERPGDADRAVAAGRAMLARVDALNAEDSDGDEPLRIGIAINSGEVVAGLVGSERRVEYTVIGDAVNVTSRIEKLNKDLGTRLLISANTVAQLSGAGELTSRGQVQLRGREQSLEVFSPAAPPARR